MNNKLYIKSMDEVFKCIEEYKNLEIDYLKYLLNKSKAV